MAKISIFYKCKCMPTEAAIQCESRLDDEDIRDYMAYITSALHVDHRGRSPLCLRDKMEYAKIPSRLMAKVALAQKH